VDGAYKAGHKHRELLRAPGKPGHCGSAPSIFFNSNAGF